ncbi:MAG: hypothetical protein ACT4ON_15870 [Bacteroidota bacterium]
MKEKTRKEKLQEALQLDSSGPVSQELNPYVKGVLYIAGTIAIVWVSQFVFSAFADAITAFKKLRKSIKND